MADQFLRRLDVENWSGNEALLLAIGFDVLSDVGFVLGDALDQFATGRENIPEIVLVVGSGCSIVGGSGGSKIGSSLLNETSLDWTGNFYEVTSNGSWAIIFWESGLLRLLGLRLWRKWGRNVMSGWLGWLNGLLLLMEVVEWLVVVVLLRSLSILMS